MKKYIKFMLLCFMLVIMNVGNVYAGEGLQSLRKPIYDSSKKVTTWDCVWYGEYPQSELICENDNDRIQEMSNVFVKKLYDEDGYFLGNETLYKLPFKSVSQNYWNQIVNAKYDSDNVAVVNGVKIKRLKLNYKTRGWDDKGGWHTYDDAIYHYFKYEPIKWRVLSIEGNEIILLSDLGIEGEFYEGKAWASSQLRSWLNGLDASNNLKNVDYTNNNFINIAFSKEEQNFMSVSKLNNIVGSETEDKVYLLQEDEINEKYGFYDDKSKQCKTSMYAFASGCYIWGEENHPELRGNCKWLVRNQDSEYPLRTVGFAGVINPEDGEYGNNVERPVIRINVTDNELYYYAGTVDSEGNYTYSDHTHMIEKVDSVNATCNSNGLTEGEYCSVCHEILKEQQIIAKKSHTSKIAIEKGTISKNGYRIEQCIDCNKVLKKTLINRIISIELSKNTYVYTGKYIKPAVKIKDSAGKYLTKNRDYTVEYSKTCKNIGTHKVVIRFKGNYKGTTSKTYLINPKSTKITKIKGQKRAFNATWTKLGKQVDGYQIQYSTNAKYKNSKAYTVKSNTITCKKLLSKKNYYVRVRSYKTVKGKKYYSAWSASKKVYCK